MLILFSLRLRAVLPSVSLVSPEQAFGVGVFVMIKKFRTRNRRWDVETGSFGPVMPASRKNFRSYGLCSSLIPFFQGARAAAEGQGRAAAAAGGARAGGMAPAKGKCGASAAGGLCPGPEGGTAGGAAPGCPGEGASVSETSLLLAGPWSSCNSTPSPPTPLCYKVEYVEVWHAVGSD